MRLLNVTIIIPVLDAGRTIDKCARALLKQKYPRSKYELIFVDNGSEDDTLDKLDHYNDDIILLKESRKGSYAARNRAIKNARGDLIAFTDSDCIADPDWLYYINRAFQNRNVNIVGGKIEAFKADSSLLKYLDVFGHPQLLSYSSDRPYFATSNMAVRMSALKKCGLFDETLKSGGDAELCIRMIRSKKEIFYEPRAIVKNIYQDSLPAFIKKHYHYGRWQGIQAKQLNSSNHVRLPSYYRILKDHGLFFVFFRLLQDVSYKVGLLSGRRPE